MADSGGTQKKPDTKGLGGASAESGEMNVTAESNKRGVNADSDKRGVNADSGNRGVATGPGKSGVTATRPGNRLDAVKSKKSSAPAFAIYSQLGVSMSLSVLLGMLAGIYADRRLGTSPRLLFVGFFLGAAASFKLIYDLARKKK